MIPNFEDNAIFILNLLVLSHIWIGCCHLKYSITQLKTEMIRFDDSCFMPQFLWPDIVYKHVYWRDVICHTHRHLGACSIRAFDWKYAGNVVVLYMIIC